jgi:thioredoxin 1
MQQKRLWIVAVVLVLVGAGAWYSVCRRGTSPAEHVALGGGRAQLIDFGMGMCVACRRMQPVMEQAARELGTSVDVHALDIRQEENMRLAERFKMRVIPLLILTDGTGKEIWRHEGVIDYPELAKSVTEKLDQQRTK